MPRVRNKETQLEFTVPAGHYSLTSPLFEVLPDEPALADYTVAQLRALAEERGIDLGDATRKADIIAVIENPPTPETDAEKEEPETPVEGTSENEGPTSEEDNEEPAEPDESEESGSDEAPEEVADLIG